MRSGRQKRFLAVRARAAGGGAKPRAAAVPAVTSSFDASAPGAGLLRGMSGGIGTGMAPHNTDYPGVGTVRHSGKSFMRIGR